MDITWFDEDVYKLLLRLGINLFFTTILIRFIYYKTTNRRDYLFTYYLIGFIIFFMCFSLKKLDIDTGMGLGLFAIFGIIRYRTNQIEIKEMTYLFIVIGLSVINSLASNKISMTELAIVNSFMLTLTYCLESLWDFNNETKRTIVINKLASININNTTTLKTELEKHTGLSLNRIEVGKINYTTDSAQIKIFYNETTK